MKSAVNCPPTDELQRLLHDSLSGERRDECVEHMDHCTGCQKRLEEIAVEGTNLSQVVEQLGASEPPATSAYWPVLKALDTDVPANNPEQTPPKGNANTPNARPPGRTRELSLSFLQPASDSAYLGRLHHFDVMRVIGRGGMGVVLEAFDTKLQRNVALKVLDPELAGDEIARQRFCRESRAAASITHENVVAVHQVEHSGDHGVPYIVMQLISGESLEERLTREKQLPLREIVRIGLQAAHGLAAAHAQGLIHRDIKPGNILLEPPHGRVKLTDFGLARVEEDVKLTRTGFVSGTPLYMAPEQALGGEPDPRSDLFSLGAILYEMYAGRPPFAGNSALAILKNISETKHAPLREVNPNVPDWFATTVDRLLAKKPADRIQTAAQLAELFDFEWALLKTTSDDVPNVCQIEIRRRTIRNRWIAAGIGTTFLALGLLGGMLFNRNAGAPPPPAVSSAEPLAVLSASSGAVWSVAFNDAGDKVAMGIEDGTVRVFDLPTSSVVSSWKAHIGFVWRVRFLPDGETVATAGDDSRIKLWKIGQSEPYRSFAHTNAVRGLARSSDGRLFAADRGGDLRVWSLAAPPPESGAPSKPVAETHLEDSLFTVAVSPNDETVATGGSDKVVRLFNAKDLSRKLALEGHAGPIYGLSFHPDGKRLASVGWNKTIHIWNTSNGEPLKKWDGHDSDIWTVAYSPDGTKLATGGAEGAVKLWDAETDALLATFLGHGNSVHSLSFDKSGKRLATGGREGSVRVWNID
jgi:serine/threonine protein kinase